jgi:predicted patatin/cPLA2 family phospholipase
MIEKSSAEIQMLKKTPKNIRSLLLGKRSDLNTDKIKYKNEQQLKLEQNRRKKIYIILEDAPLKIGYIGKNIELLNSNDHKKYISNKTKKNILLFRPDIVHRVKHFFKLK